MNRSKRKTRCEETTNSRLDKLLQDLDKLIDGDREAIEQQLKELRESMRQCKRSKNMVKHAASQKRAHELKHILHDITSGQMKQLVLDEINGMKRALVQDQATRPEQTTPQLELNQDFEQMEEWRPDAGYKPKEHAPPPPADPERPLLKARRRILVPSVSQELDRILEMDISHQSRPRYNCSMCQRSLLQVEHEGVAVCDSCGFSMSIIDDSSLVQRMLPRTSAPNRKTGEAAKQTRTKKLMVLESKTKPEASCPPSLADVPHHVLDQIKLMWLRNKGVGDINANVCSELLSKCDLKSYTPQRVLIHQFLTAGLSDG